MKTVIENRKTLKDIFFDGSRHFQVLEYQEPAVVRSCFYDYGAGEQTDFFDILDSEECLFIEKLGNYLRES